MAENTAGVVKAEVKDELEKLVDTEVDEDVVVDEDVDSDDDVVTEEEEVTTDQQHTEQERIAMESGWRPQNEWDGDPDEWVSANEFNRRGELLRKIHNQNRQIKQLDSVVNTLANQQKKIFGAGYEKAKRELKAQLREATKEGDDTTADLIEQRLEQLDEAAKQDTKALEVAQPQQPQVAPEFVPWVNRNKWFTERPEMRAYAEVIGMQYAQEHPDVTNSEVYEYITTQVKTKFPERFGMAIKKTVKRPGSPVEGSDNLTATRTGNQVANRVSLTSEEKDVGRTLVKKGLYKNMNEYAADLKKFGVKK